MNLRQFVFEHGIKKLEEDYAITVLRSREEPSLYLFKYSQLNSPFHLPVVRECRGTILDESNDWAIVTYPYEKFFNYGETNAAKLDWHNSVKVTEKTDGSLLILYWYKGKWRVSSSGIPDGTGKILLDDPVDKDSKEHYRGEDGDGNEEVDEEIEPETQKSVPINFTTFREQFWKVFEGHNYQLPDDSDRDKCFMFELACPVNRVIVVYEEENLLLHGVRDITTLQELEPVGFAEKYQWKIVQTFEYTSLDQVIEAAKKLDPIRAEGFVIRDCNFNRVKVKSPRYVQLSLLSYNNRDNLNDLRLLTILQQNEGDEFLTYFPRYTEEYHKLETAYSTLLEKIDQAWTDIKEKAENEAMLVSLVSNSPLSYRPCLWWLKKTGNGTTREYFANQQPKKLLGLLNSTK